VVVEERAGAEEWEGAMGSNMGGGSTGSGSSSGEVGAGKKKDANPERLQELIDDMRPSFDCTGIEVKSLDYSLDHILAQT
jgi:hypothetical protein